MKIIYFSIAIIFSVIIGFVFGYYITGNYIVQIEKEKIVYIGLKEEIYKCKKNNGNFRVYENLKGEIVVYCTQSENIIFEYKLK